MRITNDFVKSCNGCRNANRNSDTCIITGEPILLDVFHEKFTICDNLYTEDKRSGKKAMVNEIRKEERRYGISEDDDGWKGYLYSDEEMEEMLKEIDEENLL